MPAEARPADCNTLVNFRVWRSARLRPDHLRGIEPGDRPPERIEYEIFNWGARLRTEVFV